MIYRKSDWGCISAIMPYGDAGALPIYTSGIGWEIRAGAQGARVRHLHVEPILLISNDTYVWSLFVIRGRIPTSTRAYQAAFSNQTYLLPPASMFDLDILHFSPLRPSRPAAAEPQYPVYLDWEDESGPSVGPDETLSAFIIPAFGPVNPAANANAFITATMLGGGDTGEGPGGAPPIQVRSIQRGALGG